MNEDNTNMFLAKYAKKFFVYIIMPLCALVTLLIILGTSLPDTPNQIREKQQSQKEMIINKAFNGWNGEHKALTQAIKDSMHAPETYNHIKTFYRDDNDTLLVTMEYSGTNAMGWTYSEKSYCRDRC